MSRPKEGEKLHKRLAAMGYGSRRTIENWIEQGRITVDGHCARVGDRVDDGQQIAIDGQPVRRSVSSVGRVLLYNKPEGKICSRRDPAGRPTVFESLPRIAGGRWISVGRLDLNTRGLLLFTNDGALAHSLMHPRCEVEREYHCRIFGKVDENVRQQLLRGVDLDGRPACFSRISGGRGKGSNRWYSVTIKEGRYREVRRMWERVGCRISRLIRVRYGPVRLPKNLPVGSWQELDRDSVQKLYQAATRPGS